MTDSPSIRDRRLRIISGNPCARYASAASALILSNGKNGHRACVRADCRSVTSRIFGNRLSAFDARLLHRTHANGDRGNDRQ